MAIKEFHQFNDLFEGIIQVEGNTCWLVFLHSLEEGKGNFSKIIEVAKKEYDVVKVMIPTEEGIAIFKKKGFKLHKEEFETMTWRKEDGK